MSSFLSALSMKPALVRRAEFGAGLQQRIKPWQLGDVRSDPSRFIARVLRGVFLN
jgi:hypothetical protein